MTVGRTLLLAFGVPVLLGAQSPQSKEPPPLPLKHVGLWGSAWFALGGTQRLRAERDVNYLGGGSGKRTDNFGTSRTQLSVDLHFSPSLRLYAEGRNSTARGRDLPGGTRNSDRDEMDCAALYLETTRRIGDSYSSIRYGRQELVFGRERLVSISDFSNVRRTFEGALLSSVTRATTLNAFYVHPVVVRQTTANDVDRNVAFWGVYGVWKRNSATTIDVYYLDKSTRETAVSPQVARRTLGARMVAPYGKGWQAEIETAYQFGTTGADNVGATMIATDVTHTWAARWTPSLTIGVDRASGTAAGHGSLSETFDPLYPLAHSYVGYADVLGRRNVTELRAVAQATPIASLRLRLAAHAFRRTSAEDAAYDTGGNLFRAAADGAPMHIGDEIDVTASWRASQFFKFDVGGARFAPGAFMRATGSALGYTWGFASVTATY